MAGKINIKRVYEEPSEEDGYRVLIDRLWPRGVKKENAKLDEWLKTLSPSDDLRKWFNHEPEKFEQFKQLYTKELADKKEELKRLKDLSTSKKCLTLVYAAKDELHNNAQVVSELLKKIK